MENTKKKIFVTKSSMPPYEEYIEAIKPLWDSHWLTNMGRYHKQLESELADYLEVPEISLTVNGHMALELAIQSFGFPEGSEVITTPFTFISTTHAIVRNRLKPVFCDIHESDGTIDERKIEQLITSKTVAILPVHVYGNVCNIEGIQDIANRYNLKVIYDAAHAFGEKYKEIGVGNYGDVSIFSFHATKVFNTIEGGAVVCKSHEMYEKMYNLKNFGIRGEEIVETVGANAKMNEFSAIMGLCNLRYINQAIKYRAGVYDYFSERISTIKGIRLIQGNKSIIKNYAYFPVEITNKCTFTRNEVYQNLRENNIFARKYFYPLTADQECFNKSYIYDSIEKARSLSERTLCLPIYEGLEKRDVDRIIESIKDTQVLNRGIK